MSELVLPIALWNGPPPHSVTSLLPLFHRSLLVTGSSSGQLCIWSIDTEKVLLSYFLSLFFFSFSWYYHDGILICVLFIHQPNKESGLTPLIFCMGHNAPITALIDCTYEENDAFVSSKFAYILIIFI